VIFLCENNDAVPYNPTASGLATRDVAAYVAGYNLPSVAVDGSDVEAVYAAVAEAVARGRAGQGPSFVESRTHKGPINQSVRPGLPCGTLDLAEAWEPRADHPLPGWRDVDPLPRLARALVERGALDRARLTTLDDAVQRTVREAAAAARAAPYPPLESALEDVYA
jgi:TPP-dependent pyruvate/acetoin dehydrogenase alpha subunit